MPFETNVIVEIDIPATTVIVIGDEGLILNFKFYGSGFDVVAIMRHVLSRVRVYRISRRHVIRRIEKLHSKFWNRRLSYRRTRRNNHYQA